MKHFTFSIAILPVLNFLCDSTIEVSLLNITLEKSLIKSKFIKNRFPSKEKNRSQSKQQFL